MADTSKDTIYIDIDDEITGIIDKLRSSDAKIVALVLPKRASVFQSIVNMKLLKRAADDAKKHLVLITSEAGLLPLAGVAGVHVAKTLTSKPEIPVAPTADDEEETVDEENGEVADEPDLNPAKTVGALAGAAAVGAIAADGVETVELDDDESDDEELPAGAATGAAAAAATSSAKDKKAKKDKKLKVPNFERFRLLLVLGAIILALLIAGVIVAATVLPKATIYVTTDATSIPVSLNINLSTSVTTLDTSTNTVPAKVVTQTKTYTQQVATTGTKNEGDKASGSVTITNCDSSDVTVPAGTGMSSSGNTYITQQSVTIPDSNFTSPGSGSKCKNDGKATVQVSAQSGGASYNLPAGATFSVAGFSHLSGQSNSGISGGTDNNVQVVSQSDIDSAKGKISTTDPTMKQNLQNQLVQANYYAIPATFSSGTPTSTNSANPGEAANTVTVTETVTYTMFGAQESDLKTLVDNSVNSQIDTAKQSILSDGLATATFTVNSSTATTAQLTMETTATAGPQLDVATIKKEVAGKKSGAVIALLQSNPDVTKVAVKLSPFWVTSVPTKPSKITVVIAKPTAATRSTNASNP